MVGDETKPPLEEKEEEASQMMAVVQVSSLDEVVGGVGLAPVRVEVIMLWAVAAKRSVSYEFWLWSPYEEGWCCRL